ncbi:hypothetical protein DFA_07408 [Cavenderia fasciculata]|uniref:Pleckstrin domain-containing protein n=1 Tax=Cavenderia fasciculata TaxID=261658 RepID=F4PWC1_CACFS|nr:uncharacterized protein DFA_07408 [Cavenderia fasciculata]EGG20285.1 hypothetical protein DFA_07408 [Cavenderia fasciculata]|eukprot:XP_004367268.1 hypothetical protein DFA_07408 [Cavenderia fasciculata]
MTTKRESPKLQGYLFKEGGIYKSWKKRWFIVEGETLKYYVNESKDNSLLKGTILLSSITSVKPVTTNPHNAKSSSTSALSFSLTGSTSNLQPSHGANGRPLSSSIHNIPIDAASNNLLHHSTSGAGGSTSSTGSTTSASTTTTSTTTTNNNNNNTKDGDNHLNNILHSLHSSIDHHGEHHHYGWIFIISTAPRTYTLRASNEGEMYYWIQGLRSIQVDSHIISFTNAQKERSSKTLNRNSLELDPHFCSQAHIKEQVTGLHYQICEMKQHHSEMKSECKIAIQDFKNLLHIVQEQFKRYNVEVEQSKKKLIHISNTNLVNLLNHPNHQNHQNHNNYINHNNQNDPNNNNNNNTNNNNNNTNHSQIGNPSTNNNNNQNLITQPQNYEMYKINNNNQQQQQQQQGHGYPIAPNGMVLWYPDNSTTTCFACKQIFSFFKRRHHCRNCGRLFCSQCSDHQAIAQGYQHNVRVCVHCAKDIWTSSGIKSTKMTTNFLTFNSTNQSQQ